MTSIVKLPPAADINRAVAQLTDDFGFAKILITLLRQRLSRAGKITLHPPPLDARIRADMGLPPARPDQYQDALRLISLQGMQRF